MATGAMTLVDDQPGPLEAELTSLALWMVRVRHLSALLLLAGTAAGMMGGVLEGAVPVLVLGAVVLAYNARLRRSLRSAASVRGEPTQAARFWPALADAAALSAFLFFCGGVSNPAVVLYVPLAVCAAVLLRSRLSYLATAAALAMFAAVAVAQAASPSLHHSLGLDLWGSGYTRWSVVGTRIGGLGVAMAAAVYVTGAARRRLAGAQQQMADAGGLLDRMIASLTEGLVLLSPQGDVLLQNPAAEPWFGGDEEGAPPEVRSYLQEIARASSPLSTRVFSLDLASPAGTTSLRLRARASAVYGAAGEHLGYVIVTEDLTEQVQLEEDLRGRNRELIAMSEALRKQQREMDQHEKMVALGTMAAGIAHEIGNPLACLSAVVQLLHRRNPEGEQKEQLDTLTEQIDRIAKTVRQVLEFSRPARTSVAPTDLDDLIEQTVRMISYGRTARAADIESVAVVGLPKVRVAPQQFQQVLVNLLVNALDAVEGLSGKQRIEVTRFAREGWVYMVVRDNGGGMTRAQSRRAFEPFYTTKAFGKGTGLGLAVSYRIVERHGGRMSIESAPGKGTAVAVSFPAVESTFESAAPGDRAGV